jgi:hypothetical protein
VYACVACLLYCLDGMTHTTRSVFCGNCYVSFCIGLAIGSALLHSNYAQECRLGIAGFLSIVAVLCYLVANTVVCCTPRPRPYLDLCNKLSSRPVRKTTRTKRKPPPFKDQKYRDDDDDDNEEDDAYEDEDLEQHHTNSTRKVNATALGDKDSNPTSKRSNADTPKNNSTNKRQTKAVGTKKNGIRK